MDRLNDDGPVLLRKSFRTTILLRPRQLETQRFRCMGSQDSADGLVALTTAVSALLFFGELEGRFPSVYTSIFETLFVSFLVAIAVFVFVVARGRRRFRELWNQQNGLFANNSRSGKSCEEAI